MSSATDNRQRILDAANSIFAEGGLDGLSVRAIAARAGLSTIGVYSHFKGKRGILAALFVDGFSKLGEAARRAAENAPTERLLAVVVNGYIDFHRDHAAHYQLMFTMDRTQLGDAAALHQIASASIEKLAASIERLLPPDRPADLALRQAFRVWSLMHGYVTLRDSGWFHHLGETEWRAEVVVAVQQLLIGFQAHLPDRAISPPLCRSSPTA